jgi:hypothetical protein
VLAPDRRARAAAKAGTAEPAPETEPTTPPAH